MKIVKLVLPERSASIKPRFRRQFLSRDQILCKFRKSNLLVMPPAQVKALVLEMDGFDFHGACRLYADVNRAFLHREI